VTSEADLLKLALTAYEAACEPEVWPVFLRRYAEAVHADISLLQVHNLERHNSSIISDFGISSRLTQDYNDHYSRLNIWRERGRRLYSTGKVNLADEYCPRSVLEGSEFYNDYLLRLGATDTMAGVVTREGNSVLTLSSLRGGVRPRFGEPERETTQFLLPHMSRAWTVFQNRAFLAAGEVILDSLPLGAVLFSATGTAVRWNRAADDIFRANDGLFIRNGILSAADRRADAQVQKLIDDALHPTRSPRLAAARVPRPSLRREYLVIASPLLRQAGELTGVKAPRAVAIITDPERHEPAQADLLIQIYDLTPKEAAVAAKLSEGKSVEQVAEELSVTYETARTHLRRIFSKTRTSRQSELLLLLARLAAIRGGALG